MARLMPLLMIIIASIGSLMIVLDVSGVRPGLIVGIFTGPGSVSRVIALLVILTNLKVFPFVWHIRIFNALFQHFFLSFLDNPDAPSGPAALFQPIVTSSRAPLLECDYNFHKSNSTFFADLDVTRIHLLARLFRKGITKLRKTPDMVSGPDGVPAKGNLMIILGGTHCSFRREIKPFQAYEMWSRVLAWDQKWIYIVTHFVKPGSAKPKPKSGNNYNAIAIEDQKTTLPPPSGPPPDHLVLASAISKYVLKLDRLTINPEVLLHASDLLPPSNPDGGADAPDGGANTPNRQNNQHHHSRQLVDEENERGMKFATSFGVLDGLHEIFEGEKGKGGGGGVLGYYADL